MSFEVMANRLNYFGGRRQQDRMIRDKLHSLQEAIKYSYTGAHFTVYNNHSGCKNKFTGLFNAKSLTMTYDVKMISTPYDNNLHIGDVFKWDEDKSFWICCTQDKTELAYFRAECRLCNYSIQWIDKNRKKKTVYASVIGNNNTNVGNNNTKATSIAIDYPNADATILISDSPENRDYFHQYQTFVLRGFTYSVQQIDDLSLPGILKLFCTRSYSNLMEDDVEQDCSNVWNVQPIIEHTLSEVLINGERVIKPLFQYTYKINVEENGKWRLENLKGTFKNNTIPYEINCNGNECTLTWTNRNEGAFDLCYYDSSNILIAQKQIIVESLM